MKIRACLHALGGVALRDALIAATIVMAVSATTGYVVHHSAAIGLKREVQDNLQSIANTASGLLDGDLHQQITEPDQKGSELYERTRAPFYTLLRANPNIAFIYTVIPKDDKIFFVLDSKIIKPGEKDDTSGVMEEYTDGTETMKRALAERITLVEDEAYTDEWGTFLSAYTPIYNSKHEYLGIVGADIRLTDYLQRLANIHEAFMIGLAMAILASIMVGTGVWYVRVAALKSEARNREQQDQMIEMEKARLSEIEENKRTAEEEKRREIAQMADTFETTVKTVVAEVANMATQMQAGVAGVTHIAADTKQRSSAVASACSEASSNATQATASASELNSSIGEISRQTQKSTQIATEASGMAESAQHIIESLGEKSKRVSSIIDVITGIADQINLLALNATIEAARAGDAGKGFSVVASEVKNLANQVSKETGEILRQVGEMQTATTQSIEAVMKIIGIIGEVASSTSSVAAAVERQSVVTGEITRNIGHTSDSTRRISQEIVGVQDGADKTGDTAKQVLHYATELEHQSGLLRQKVDEFLASIRAA